MPQGPATRIPDPDNEVEKFLDSWSSYPDEEFDCPPDFFLVEVSKANLVDQSFPTGSQKATWLEHVKSCPHCKRIVQLLRDPKPSKLTVQHILARASRDAQEITSKPRHRRHIIAHPFSWTHDHHPLQGIGLQPIAAAALVVIFLVGVLYVRQSGFFETPSEVATTSFPRNEAKELRESLYADVLLVQNTRIPRQEEQKYVDDYNQSVNTIKRLKAENKIPEEERGDIAKLMAQYKSQLTDQMARNRDRKPDSMTSADPKLGAEQDTQAVLLLVSNVDQAISKKNDEVSSVTTEVPNPETIKIVLEQIDVKMNDTKVTVYDKVANRSPDDSEALLKGVRLYASQEKRSVFLNQGNESKTVVPITTFTRKPNE